MSLWLRCRSFGGMAGMPLPCPGSVGEQPAALLDAFAILEAIASEKRDEH